jgi:hypothetical protein
MKEIKVTGRKIGFSSDVLARSPELRRALGTVDTPKPQQDAGRALVKKSRLNPSRTRRLACIVTLIRAGGRRLDPDNLATSFKPLQDAIANTLELDDGDSRIEWQYRQIERGKAESGTIVKIELL